MKNTRSLVSTAAAVVVAIEVDVFEQANVICTILFVSCLYNIYLTCINDLYPSQRHCRRGVVEN